MFYNVVKLATVDNRQLLMVRGADDIPMITVYDEHAGQTLVRMCASNLENLKYALKVLEFGES